jgi:hypothetical protein
MAINSKNTSINNTRLPRLYGYINRMVGLEGKTVLDLGCGNPVTQQLIRDSFPNTKFILIDKFWQGTNLVHRAWKAAYSHKVDLVVISNVLNVIDSDSDLVELISSAVLMNTDIYITIYEGDKSGIGKETTRGYQRNQKISYYMKYFSPFYFNVEVCNNVVKVTHRK